MGSSSDHGVRDISRHLMVLLPSSIQKPRISGELARRLEGSGGTVLLVSPLGSKVWCVQVGQDDDRAAFLGRGWPEFVAAHGIVAGWFVVFRHEGRGVLTVRAFDTSCCRREFTRLSSTGSRRPQFIKVLLEGFTEKMAIPAKFVRNYMADAQTTKGKLTALLSLGKFWRVELEMAPSSGKLFFAGGWSTFLASHGIAQGDALLLRHEGNMVFTVKVFGLDGCHKNLKPQKPPMIQETCQGGQTVAAAEVNSTKPEGSSPSSGKKRKNMNEKPNSDENARLPTIHIITPKKESPSSRCYYVVYQLGPPSWLEREINAYVLKRNLSLPLTFCRAIGLQRSCQITLNTATNDGTIRSWQVALDAYSNGCRQLSSMRGWRAFCQVNALMEGDVCTFNVMEPEVWRVKIKRCSNGS